MKSLLMALALCLALPANAADRQDANLARNLAATCANCHGTNGAPPPGSGMATLAGVPNEQLMRQLMAFRGGTRPSTIMQQISRGYSEAELTLVAAWYAERKAEE